MGKETQPDLKLVEGGASDKELASPPLEIEMGTDEINFEVLDNGCLLCTLKGEKSEIVWNILSEKAGVIPENQESVSLRGEDGLLLGLQYDRESQTLVIKCSKEEWEKPDTEPVFWRAGSIKALIATVLGALIMTVPPPSYAKSKTHRFGLFGGGSVATFSIDGNAKNILESYGGVEGNFDLDGNGLRLILDLGGSYSEFGEKPEPAFLTGVKIGIDANLYDKIIQGFLDIGPYMKIGTQGDASEVAVRFGGQTRGGFRIIIGRRFYIEFSVGGRIESQDVRPRDEDASTVGIDLTGGIGGQTN